MMQGGNASVASKSPTHLSGRNGGHTEDILAICLGQVSY
jgi:hypothetical protein